MSEIHRELTGAAQQIDDLLRRYAELVEDFNRADRERTAAYELIPWWAKSGPSFLNADGVMYGLQCGWPAITDATPPRRGVTRNIRPNFAALRNQFEAAVRATCWSPSRERYRVDLRAVYRKQVRDLVARLRAKHQFEAAAGLPHIERRAEAAIDRLNEVEDAIRDFPDDRGDPAVTAAKVLLAMRWEAIEDTQCPAGADCNAVALVGILRTLQPALKGFVSVYVGDILDNPNREFRASAFWPKA